MGTYKTGVWGEQAKARSLKRKDYFRNYRKKRYAQQRTEILAKMQEFRIKHPEIIKAGYLAHKNIEIPQGQICEKCHIAPATQRHHPDYSKPLEVQFLCCSCHTRKNNKPYKEKGCTKNLID